MFVRVCFVGWWKGICKRKDCLKGINIVEGCGEIYVQDFDEGQAIERVAGSSGFARKWEGGGRLRNNKVDGWHFDAKHEPIHSIVHTCARTRTHTGNGDVNGDGDRDRDGAGTRTGVKANEGTQNEN